MPKRPSAPRGPVRDLLAVRLRAMEQQQRETNVKLHDVERRLEHVDHRLAQLDQRLETGFADVVAAIQRLGDRLASVEDGVGPLRTRLEALEARVERLEAPRTSRVAAARRGRHAGRAGSRPSP